ncbi:MAG: carboxy terminal-processing peptidase, partial [candidate division KSB1 bacterium]
WVALLQAGTPAKTDLVPNKQHPMVSKLVAGLFSHYHYGRKEIDDSLSSALFNFYLDSLDPYRSVFLASDIAAFEKYRYNFDNNLNDGELAPAFAIYNTFLQRFDERIATVTKVTAQGFEYTTNEFFEYERENVPWPKTSQELDDFWRKRLKNEALNLKLTGKTPEEIAGLLTKRYTNYHKRIKQNTAEDVVQIYLNAFAEVYDPHSNYLSPIASQNFGIDMSLSLEGIGAQLESDGDYTQVARIIAGGPADFSKQLWPNDKIVAVGQGEANEMVDVIGWRLDDVVQLIRGARGTKVRLDIIPANAGIGSQPKRLLLVREKVILHESEAKSDTLELVQDGQKYRIGVITLPSFYSNLGAQQRGEKDFKSTTRDVRRLLRELKSAEIDGVVIDLRGNSGGSLQEAIELTGLFFDEGPVVQVRNSDGTVKVMRDPDRTVEYDGPLGVLVDRRSASASEIFAAAIQDYNRGVILGSTTFGKGTVQNLIELDRYMRNTEASLGELKLTVAKFYRIDGGTTQYRGVVPDIHLASVFEDRGFGESTEKNALPWDQIETSSFTRKGEVKKYLAQLTQRSQKRTALNLEFRYLNEDIQALKQESERKKVSLQEGVRKLERDKQEDERFAKNNERRTARGLKPLKKGEKAPEHEKAPDAQLDETTRVLADLIAISNATLQARER